MKNCFRGIHSMHEIESLLLTGCWTPCRRYRQAFVAAVEEPQHIAAEDVTDILHSANTGTIWLYRPMRHVKRCVHHWQIIFFRRVLKRERYEFFSYSTGSSLWNIIIFFVKLTKYRSVATDTRIRSSPTRTFSPSDLCLEAGCTVHQHASPSRIKKKTLRNFERVTHEILFVFLDPWKVYRLYMQNFSFNSVKSYNCV